jgi:hypothetical protein
MRARGGLAGRGFGRGLAPMDLFCHLIASLFGLIGSRLRKRDQMSIK